MVALPQRLGLDSADLRHARAAAGASARDKAASGAAGVLRRPQRPPLYTPEERRRRDESPWTIVQGILAPLQFLVFLVSLALVVRFLLTGEGEGAATVSILVKTGVLYLIMVTGAIWEKVVFGRYLFAPAFFWEDLFSMLVLALHTAYVVMLLAGIGSVGQQMAVALAAYAAYVINAGQFVWKLRQARIDAPAGGAAA
ncbi:2-vinyl bacteriochlorophyllide hydratase [Thermaurantiacus tibetensis]|uniref:2-vinyl bacteriochlorophyllide hydratase n=1 Tax=Thermaurantiacus tibetensis TaxID=2759035 RepID=UPI00188ED45D|nr:2-vinyl bacteriochlorophyllide hydratase [Thermaurantiacus tibetensis]